MALVMDMASRRVLGFALGERHDAQLACSALVMAVALSGSPGKRAQPNQSVHAFRGTPNG
jgi:putative transposase